MKQNINSERKNQIILNMKNLSLFVIISAFLFSCSSNVDLAIDNPSDEYLEVRVDDLVVEVAPKQIVWVEMGKGDHKVKVEGGDSAVYKFSRDYYMLNPTNSEYLKIEQFYGTSLFGNDNPSQMPKKTVNFLGLELEGSFDVVKGFVIPVTWDVMPREEFPETVQIEGPYAFLTKIMDAGEFKDLVGQSSADEETSPN